MPEWAFVVIFGAVGGSVNVLFLGGTDVPLSPLWAGVESTRFHAPYRFLQNTILGAMASFITWALVSGASFESLGTTPFQVVGSLVAGGAGVPIVNSFFRQAQAKKQIDTLTDLLSERTQTSPPQTPPQGGGGGA